MTAAVDDVRGQLGAEFVRACEDLADALAQVRAKDTPAGRAAVARCRASVDAVLDVYLELVCVVPRRESPRPAPS